MKKNHQIIYDALKNKIEYILNKKDVDIFSIAIVLSFDVEDNPEVILGVCTKKEVDKWLVDYGEKAKSYIWNAAEYHIYDEPELFIECSLVETLNSRHDWLETVRSYTVIFNKIFNKNRKCKIYFYSYDLDDDVDRNVRMSVMECQYNELIDLALL